MRIDEDVDFTNGDAVLETVLDVITCPIQREIRENMIIFNDQCYDRSDFESYRIREDRKSRRRVASNYSSRFMDPRTGKLHRYGYAMKYLFHSYLVTLTLTIDEQVRFIVTNMP